MAECLIIPEIILWCITKKDDIKEFCFKIKNCCKNQVKYEELEKKINDYLNVLVTKNNTTNYDIDPVRNDLFKYVIETYLRNTLKIWEKIFTVYKNDQTVENLYQDIQLLVIEKKNTFKNELSTKIHYENAINLFTNFVCQYDRLFLGHLSTLTMNNELTEQQIISLLVDMHISICNTMVLNACVTLPSINGDLDGIVFNGQVSEIKYHYNKKQTYDRLIKYSNSFERTNSDQNFNFYIILITDPENDDEVCYVSQRFANNIEYNKSEIVGKHPQFLQYENGIINNKKLSNSYLSMVNSVENNRTTVCKITNYTKSGYPFEKNIIIKTIMDNNTRFYRISLQYSINNLIDIHAFKSYIDILFGSSESFFSTIFKRENNNYRLLRCYTFDQNFFEYCDSIENKYIQEIIKIPGGETKIMNLIDKPELFHKTLTIYSNYNINNITYHAKNIIILNTDKSPNKSSNYLFVIHLKT
tara:strand:+ start:7046 stop:8461 length:1416 start_codon:yes stop_codon:yes gene_type:complete